MIHCPLDGPVIPTNNDVIQVAEYHIDTIKTAKLTEDWLKRQREQERPQSVPLLSTCRRLDFVAAEEQMRR